jgi:hypothetical protein
MRKQVILKKRRVGWKNYVILSSNWVKPLLKLKQVINFTQSKSTYNYSTTYSHPKIFNNQSNQFSSVGLGIHPLNYTTLNMKMVSFFNKQQVGTKPNKFFSNAHFNSLQPINKLGTLGFIFPNLVYGNNYYPLKQITLYLTQLNTKNSTVQNLTVSIRSVLTYLTLLHVSKLSK